MTAISNLEGYEATAPEDITVSGFNGKEFTLTAPDTDGCGATWATADRVTGMGAGEVNLLRILDVDGERIVITRAYPRRKHRTHPWLPLNRSWTRCRSSPEAARQPRPTGRDGRIGA